MSDASATDAPSLASLLKALAVAIGLAVVLLVLVVLPAEYNIDVTGFGGAIGVTALSAPQAEPAPQPVSSDAAAMVAVGQATREDETVVDLSPGKGLEYKFRIRAGEKLTYSWKSDTGGLFYDFHGEPAGAAKDVFESYAAGKASSVKGVLTTPFEGTHGWYWKNRSQQPIRITLVTSGAYEVLGLR